jgi:hypothetical protein
LCGIGVHRAKSRTPFGAQLHAVVHHLRPSQSWLEAAKASERAPDYLSRRLRSYLVFRGFQDLAATFVSFERLPELDFGNPKLSFDRGEAQTHTKVTDPKSMRGREEWIRTEAGRGGDAGLNAGGGIFGRLWENSKYQGSSEYTGLLQNRLSSR